MGVGSEGGEVREKERNSERERERERDKLITHRSIAPLIELGQLSGVASILRFPLPEPEEESEDSDQD